MRNLSLFVLLVLTGSADAGERLAIEVWTRGEPKTLIEFDAEPASVYDGRTKSLVWAKGAALLTILAQRRIDQQLDLALLHFQNGMIVPLPFRDVEAMKRLDPFVATGGQLIVRERWHPYLPGRAAQSFSPWSAVDSLVGIELASARGYEGQFAVNATRAASDGARLFTHYCLFCHGARRMGASYAPDVVEALPMSWIENPNRLYYHIAFDERFEARRSPMPVLSFVSQAEAKILWLWLQAIRAQPLKPYQN